MALKAPPRAIPLGMDHVGGEPAVCHWWSFLLYSFYFSFFFS
jgi:hypothetical protein